MAEKCGNELFDPDFLFDPLYIMGPILTPYALLQVRFLTLRHYTDVGTSNTCPLMYRYTRREPCSAETGSTNYGNKFFDPHFLFDPLYIMGSIFTRYALLQVRFLTLRHYKDVRTLKFSPPSKNAFLVFFAFSRPHGSKVRADIFDFSPWLFRPPLPIRPPIHYGAYLDSLCPFTYETFYIMPLYRLSDFATLQLSMSG